MAVMDSSYRWYLWDGDGGGSCWQRVVVGWRWRWQLWGGCEQMAVRDSCERRWQFWDRC
jgi:hypothetical protein